MNPYAARLLLERFQAIGIEGFNYFPHDLVTASQVLGNRNGVLPPRTRQYDLAAP